jgi:H+/Cl- antiporter ClcA
VTAPPPRLSGRDVLRLILLAAALGIPAAFVAALFLALVRYLQDWLWTDLPDALGHSSPPWYLVLGLPVAGAAIVVAARRFLAGDGGHEPLGGLHTEPTPIAHAPGVALAALATLSCGAVLGPEAPVVALGSVVGVAAASLVATREREKAVLSSAGSFSAVSALFGGPVVGGVLMVEAGVGLGAALIPALLPGFVAAAFGYLIFVGLGDWGGLDAPGLVVPDLPAYEGTHALDLAVAVAIGVAAALALALVHRGGTRVAAEGGRRLTMPLLLLGGGLAVGAIALLADALGADSQDVLFSGQASIPALISEDSTGIVLLLLLAKALAYVVCLACGFRGGPIFPAIFIGIALATLPVVWFDMSPTVAIAIGAAAGMAAVTRLLLVSILFASLLVGTQGLDAVSAAVLAAAAAWLTATALRERATRSNP